MTSGGPEHPGSLADALRRSEERYRRLYEAVPIGLYRTNADCRIEDANPAMAHMLGFASVDAMRGRMGADLYVHPEVHATLLDRVRGDGVVQAMEAELRRQDGTVLRALLSARATVDGAGRILHIEGTVQDITQRASLEARLRQAQKMEAVGQLAGGIAHDFNNLLGVIIGYSDLLLRDLAALPAPARRVSEIRAAAERAATLTRQLLAFGRRQVLQPRVLDLNAVVRDAEAMLVRLIGEDVEIVTRLAPDVGRVKADPGQLEQVILNFAVNSRDAMPRGGTLTVETANVEIDARHVEPDSAGVPGPFVALIVSDTGHGMPREVLDHVFEPFFTTKEQGKGTGLGLATVYGIVTQSGGHLEVESAVGGGTTFKVFLPRVDAAAAEARAADREPARGGETILLIEDALPLREMVQEILQEAGYAVLSAAHAAEALDVAAAHAGPIALVITDVVMPGLSGPAVAEKLAVARPESRVLFMSGYPDEAIGQRGNLEPGTHFLQKPFSGEALLSKVRAVLDQRTGA